MEDPKPKQAKQENPEQKPKPAEKRETKQIKHTFTREEREKLSGELVQHIQETDRLEIEFQGIKERYKGSITTSQGRVAEVTGKLSSGCEWRWQECRVEFDHKAGKKRYFRTDTGELALLEDMTREDYQLKLVPDPDKCQFEKATVKTFELWKADKDLGTLTIGRAGGQWYFGAQLVIGSRKGDMPLSPEGKAHKNRFDCVRQGAKAVLAWIKDVAPEFVEGFEPKIKEVVESQKEIVE